GRGHVADPFGAGGRVLIAERDERCRGLDGVRSVHIDPSTRLPAGLFRETVGSFCGEGAVAAGRVRRADRRGGRGHADGAPRAGGSGRRRAGGRGGSGRGGGGGAGQAAAGRDPRAVVADPGERRAGGPARLGGGPADRGGPGPGGHGGGRGGRGNRATPAEGPARAGRGRADRTGPGTERAAGGFGGRGGGRRRVPGELGRAVPRSPAEPARRAGGSRGPPVRGA